MERIAALSEPLPGPAPARTTDWRLVAVFYSVNVALVSLLALGLYVSGPNLAATNAQLIFQFTVAFLYMPAPLISALIAERVGKRRQLIRTTFQDFGRKLPRLLVTVTSISLGTYAVFLALAFVFGSLVRVPGVGRLVTSQAGLLQSMSALVPVSVPGAAATRPALNLPPLGLLYVIAPIGGLMTGLTVNGLFAFGEEYGWRGFLMDELRPLGPIQANLLTGLLWGVWHAPIILLGYDYAPHRFLGILAMVGLCTPYSFVLWRARQLTDSLLAPAILHGAFNGFGGFFLVLLLGRNPVASLPIGLLGGVGMTIVATVFWNWSPGRSARALRHPSTPTETRW